MRENQERVVLKSPEPRKAIDVVAYRDYWSLQEVVPQSESAPLQVIWRDKERDVLVVYTEDFILELAYVTLTGERRGEIAELLRARIPSFAREDVFALADAAGEPGNRVHAAYVAAASAPAAYDEPFFRLFERFFGDPEPDVRRAAVWGAGYVEWKELRPPLESLRDADPDPEVRADAARMLEGLEQVWNGANG